MYDMTAEKKFCFVFFALLFFFGQVKAEENEEYAVNKSAYDSIGVSAAYTAGFSGKNVTVAIVDNGILKDHQEFKDKFSELQKDEYNSQKLLTHGTAVAGLIVGAKDGNKMHGIAYDAKILSFAVALADDGECADCYSVPSSWLALADDGFDNVKIINNSFGTLTFLPTIPGNSESTAALMQAPLEALVAKDKLIVASAGNETNLSPASNPAGSPYFNTDLKNNIISVVAYNSKYKPSSPYFLESYTNLSLYAQKWSLAAPGGELTTASSKSSSSYGIYSGTSFSAPIVSGSAAVVLSAFPYMGGKQLADVLFSTANKDYGSFSNYMVQKDDSKNQFLFFGTSDGYGKNWTDAEKQSVVQSELGNSYNCSSEKVVCVDVSYADVFGQGVLNLEKAIKGPGYFDANRLSDADHDGTQYLYSIDTQNYDSTWSNNIGQVKKDGNESNVGLKKAGSGQLTLSGANTYLGDTVVTEGTLRLTGSLTGKVDVSGGTFYLNGGNAPQITVSSDSGKVLIDSGKADRLINNGVVRQSGGSVSSVKNNKDYYFNGGAISAVENTERFYFSGGAVSGKIQNTGTFQNNGALGKNIVSGGTLINGEKGKMYLTSTPETLINYGHIVLSPIAKNSEELQKMKVSHLNLVGGNFSLDMNNLPKLGENKSYLVLTATDTLTVGENFNRSDKIGQYISSRTTIDDSAKTVSVSLEYVPLASNSPSLTTEERKTAAVVDRLFRTDGLNLADFYFLDEKGLKKQINKIKEGTKPVRFSSLPLSGKLTRGVYTHVFERQKVKDLTRYGGKNQYYSPSPRRMPKSDIYRRYRPENAPQKRYYHQTPKKNDVYRYYRSGRSGGSDYANRNQVWGQAFMHDGTFKADKTSGLSKTKNSGAGGMFGLDFVLSDNFLWGLTTGYSSSDVKQDKDKTDITDLRFGTYFSKQKGFASIDGVLMFGRQKYDKTRMTVLPTNTYKSTASFNGTSLEAALNLGYDIQSFPVETGSLSMRPYVGVSVVKTEQDAYREKGQSDVNLSVKKTSDTSVTASPGVIAGFVGEDISIFGFKPEYVFADLRYDILLSGGNPKVKAYFSADTLQETFDFSNKSEKSDFSVGFITAFQAKTYHTERFPKDDW